jgi:hypothetical protein
MMLTNDNASASSKDGLSADQKETEGDRETDESLRRKDSDLNDDDGISHNSSSKEESSNITPDSSSFSGNSSHRDGMNDFQTNKEDRHIFGAKCIFLTLLMSAAAGLGAVTYFSIQAAESRDFQAHVSI